jgi:uncharacterized protein YhjY with autotransporter beta-barrel domain
METMVCGWPFSCGHSFYDNNRIALGLSDKSDARRDQVGFQTRIGYNFEAQDRTLTLLFGLNYSHIMIDSFTENDPAALNIAEDEADSFRSSLGGRVRYT